MKINLIIPSFYPATIYGGPIFSTLHTCEQLAKLDDIVMNVSTTNANMTTRLDVKTNKNIKFEDNFYVKYYNETVINYFSFALISKVWKDIQVADVIHSQVIFRPMTPMIFIYAKIFKKPLLYSPRGTLGSWCISNGNRFKKIWLKLFLAPFANSILWHATAKQEKNEILAVFPKAKIEVIPNGIKYETFQNYSILSKKDFLQMYAKKELAIDKIIISMGRLQKKKGFDILINSFPKVLEDYPLAKLFIAGGDEGEEQNLLSQIKNLDLQDKVFLTGALNDQNKINFLSNADLFVLPSHNENFGNVYIESLASGTPIIASKDTPWSEVEKFNCGKWINNSIDETSQAIIDMLKQDRKEMRINAKKFAKEYDWKNIAIQFQKLFKSMKRS